MKSESKSMAQENTDGSVQHRHSLYTPRAANSGGKFNLPVSYKRRINSVTFDIATINETDNDQHLPYNWPRNHGSLRRMSAPELPPISDRVKYSPSPQLVTNQNGRRISYSTKTSESIPHSGTSEGSGRGNLAKSPQSGVSSSSSNGQNQIVKLVNGHKLSRGKTWCVPEQTNMSDHNKLECIKNKKNSIMTNGTYTPRSTTKTTYRSRLSSKENSIGSGNNNNNSFNPFSGGNGRKSLTQCRSDPKIVPIDEMQKQKTFIKGKGNPILSRQKTLSVDKTENLTGRQRFSTGNVNGMRKYSSQLVLNSHNSVNASEDVQEDSDSDSTKDQFIIDWIIGVENEDTEPPPEQDIDYPEAPPQTDTAIHIVYNED